MHSPKIAIVCDWLIARGGAERVIIALSQIFPQAPLYTTIYDEASFPEFKNKTVITSFLNKMPFARRKHSLYLPFMPYAFEQFDLSEFDIVISSCHSCSKGIITKPSTLHICYCHSPMRYVWDGCHEYVAQYGIPKLLQGSARRLLHKIRLWDRLAADRVDRYIANSKHVQARIEKYYRRPSEVIYPPVDTDFFTLAEKKEHEGHYYLAVGRLTTYKKFDLIVECFNELKLPLVIVGTGKDEAMLRKKAGRFITFLGKISNEELREVYQKAKALIFPQVEDFGITPLEAMSCGRPVIAFGNGGALETVVEGTTGIFFKEQSVAGLKKAILESSKIQWNHDAIRKHALTFSQAHFAERLKAYVEKSWHTWKQGGSIVREEVNNLTK